MDLFRILSLIGGLCLFLFGMSLMGDALERRAGSKLQVLLSKLTTNKMAGFLTGLAVTSVIQSSSATTVMVVGFVNSGLMTLKQAINVIMGANVGTTVTAWILSLGGIDSNNVFISLLKPTSFTPILALAGIILFMFFKDSKKKDVGMILLGFAVLMFGMDTMTDAVSVLEENEAFRNLFVMFSNPILGVLVGAIVTAIIQSSSASVGILQAFAETGAVSYGAAIPIIMGQNIGTCITAILSSFGTNRNAKRAALVHLFFNIIGTVVWLSVYTIVDFCFAPELFGQSATLAGIAVCHSAFNIACTALLLPMSSVLEKIAYKLVPETEIPDKVEELDERLLATPAVALERCHSLACEMAKESLVSLKDGAGLLKEFSKETYDKIMAAEDKSDRYEDIIGNYLVKLSALKLNDHDSAAAAKLLKTIGDLERISDHTAGLAKSAEEMFNKKLSFSEEAQNEIVLITKATEEILSLATASFENNDVTAATAIEPLEQIIDELKDRLRTKHTVRPQQGICSIELGFVWADILTDLERISDHCSNIAGCVLETTDETLELHRSVRAFKKDNPMFQSIYSDYAEKYL